MVVCTKCDRCRDNRYQWNRVRPKVFTSCRWIPGLIDYPRIGHCECNQSWCPTHCLGSRGSSDVERDSCLVKQEPHLSPSQIFLKFDLHIIVLYNCLHCYTTEPVPSTSSVGKRPTTPSTESSSKRVKQDSEELPLYWICGDCKVTCQAPYYGGLGLIWFRRKGLDYDGNAMDRTVFVTKDELTSLKTELPRAIEIMNNLSTQRNLPNKRHLMARLSPPDSSRMRYIEVSVFKKSMTSSVRVFYFKDGLRTMPPHWPTKKGVLSNWRTWRVYHGFCRCCCGMWMRRKIWCNWTEWRRMKRTDSYGSWIRARELPL